MILESHENHESCASMKVMNLRDTLRRMTGDHDRSVASERTIAKEENQPRPMSVAEIEATLNG